MAELFLKGLELKGIRGELQIVEEKISVANFFQRHIEYCRLNKAVYKASVDVRKIGTRGRYLKGCGITKLNHITALESKGSNRRFLERETAQLHSTDIWEFLKAALNKAVECGLFEGESAQGS
jgi:hypothetical protein